MFRTTLSAALMSPVMASVGVAQTQCLHFVEHDSFPIDDFAFELVHADLNADGHEDLLVGSQGPLQVEVLLGSGTGDFVGAPSVTAPGGAIGGLAVGDLSGDGIPDLVLASSFPAPGFLQVSLGVGDGSFGPATYYSTRPEPGAVLLHDVDGNGALDIVTVNESSDGVSVLLGAGDGSFGPARLFATRNGPREVAVIELNGDAAPDLAVTNFYSDNISILVGVGDGTFVTSAYVVEPGTQALAVGDVTSDAIDDLVTTRYSASGYRLYSYAGLGNGTFGPEQASPDVSGMPSKPLVLYDVDGDGLLDAVGARDDRTTVRRGSGDGLFGSLEVIEGGYDQRAIAIDDFDEDGRPDFAVLSRAPDEVRILLQRPTGAESYCNTSPNSAGVGALITATGSFRVADDDLQLSVSALPPHEPGLFFCGDLEDDVPFEGGTLCVGGTHGLFRILPALDSGAAGVATLDLELFAPPFDQPWSAVLPGSSWSFQYWYRDAAATPGSASTSATQ